MWKTAWLAFSGDMMILRPLSEPERRSPLFALLRAAECSVGNLEVPLTTAAPEAEKASTLRADPERAQDVAEMGFDVVTLANNHALDCGLQGLRDTIAALETVGVQHVGTGANQRASYEPVFRETSGGKVAIFGVASTLPPGFAAGAFRPGIAPIRVLSQFAVDPAVVSEQPGIAPFVHTQAHQADVDSFCEFVSDAKSKADFVAVMIHWGVPHGWVPLSQGVLAEYQRPLAHALIDAGADIVVGNHPHAVHPVEVYQQRLIAYSLGNFVFQAWPELRQASDKGRYSSSLPMAPYRNPFNDPATLESVLLLAQRGERVSYRFVPTLMSSDGNPIVADPVTANRIIDRLEGNEPDQYQIARLSDAELNTIVGEVIL